MRIVEALNNRYIQKERKIAESEARYTEKLTTLEPGTFLSRLHDVKKCVIMEGML
jgi:hypothetical protein